MQDGVVLGADTRSTAGTTVADKNCEKIHYIAPNIFCCGAGTAADTENVTGMPVHPHVKHHGSVKRSAQLGCTDGDGAFYMATMSNAGMISSQLELHRYALGRQTRVVTAMTLLKSHLFQCVPGSSVLHDGAGLHSSQGACHHACTAASLSDKHDSGQITPRVNECAARYQGHVSAALVLGGVDVRGPHLFTVYPHGSTDALPYATMGSGSLNAMAVFEDGFRCSSSVVHFWVLDSCTWLSASIWDTSRRPAVDLVGQPLLRN
jgi:20S proteasome subunit beta 2